MRAPGIRYCQRCSARRRTVRVQWTQSARLGAWRGWLFLAQSAELEGRGPAVVVFGCDGRSVWRGLETSTCVGVDQGARCSANSVVRRVEVGDVLLVDAGVGILFGSGGRSSWSPGRG